MYDVGPPTAYCINNKTVSLEGDKVRLICTSINDFDAIHSLQVNWYKGYQLVIPNGNRVFVHNMTDKTSSQLNSTLLLDPVNPTDHEIYACRALNHPESYSECSIDLTVQCTVDLYTYRVAG